MGRASSRKRMRPIAERAHLQWAGEMCASCAYRAGTEANRDCGDPGLTRTRELLLEACEPFYCHEPCPADVAAVLGPQRKLCVGHMHAMSARTRRGEYGDHETVMAKKQEAYVEIRKIRARCDQLDTLAEGRA